MTTKTKVLLPGRKRADAPSHEAELSEFLDVEVVAAHDVDARTRGTAAEQFTVVEDAAEDDVVEIEFDNGLKQWVSVAQLRADLASGGAFPGAPTSARGAAEVAASPDELLIPSSFMRGDVTRGRLSELGVKAVKLLRAKLTGGGEAELAKLTAKGVAALLEKKLEGQLNVDGPGVYHFNDSRVLSDKVKDGAALNSKEPYLLFLHGTASSSIGSFSQLGVLHSFDQLGLMDTPEWEALRRNYADRILAFEHRSMSESPLQNALQLAQTMPAGAKLHLVSHSRGGLVGELLCLGQVKELDPKLLFKPFEEAGRDDDIKNLRALLQVLLDKRFQVERFVRVACPARGTTLASRRLDLYLSGVTNLMGLIPFLKGSATFNFTKSTLLQLAKLRTDPKELPGIEAMMPESPFIFMLNGLGLTTQSDLAVIAGDVEGGDFIDRLKMLLPDAFYREQNDLIVNTGAMRGGLRREPEKAFIYFDQGPEVNHFNYFTNQATRSRVVNWLGRDGADLKAAAEKAGFSSLAPAELKVAAPRGVTRAAAVEELPVVFVLPGIMGSHLKAKGERVWLNPLSLAFGGMKKLALDAADVQADALVGSAYQRLVQFLRASHSVVEFPYDWRLPLTEAAGALAEAVKSRLQPKRPIRFLAHSMGGLVVRALIAEHPDVWEQVRARDGRVVMLGTPNRGSFVIPQLLARQERLFGLLSLFDLKQSKAELAAIISRYPGLADMLPEQCFDKKFWDDLKFADRPPDDVRTAAGELRRKLAEKGFDKERMVYVAGVAPSTPFDVSLVNDKLVFKGTTAGDGRVTYEQGLIDGVKTWYVEAAHGDLADHAPSFPALVELLERGGTQKLSTAPPVSRGLSAEHVIPADEAQSFPDDDELAAAALGGAGLRKAAAVEPHTLQITVTHGDLQFASYPVAVGHYNRDLIVGAEKVIDKHLKGRLSQLHQMGLYPSKEGAAEVVPGTDQFPGALIIGLGEVGEVTLEKVRTGVATAALRHALRVLSDAKEEPKDGWLPAGLSTLLIGNYSFGQALSVPNSVAAIIQGLVQANRTLNAQGLWGKVRINALEIIELYEDVASQAIKAVEEMTKRPPLELAQNEGLKLIPPYLNAKGRGWPQRPAGQYSSDQWDQVRIGSKDASVGQTGKAMQFTLMSDRAREVAESQPTQRRLVDSFVDAAVNLQRYDEKLGSTLFELLVPNDFKEHIGFRDKLLLILDADSAQYPWELLAERTRTGVRPLASEKGMIRKLMTEDFRANPQGARSNCALVIGDPLLADPQSPLASDSQKFKFPPLPGARAEAEAVARVLAGKYQVTSLIQSKALSIVGALFEQDYRIVHLAGHGFYDPADPANSGVVLNDGLHLTSAELHQLRQVPDLVFINCCYLGQIDRPNEDRPPFAANKLAASIAQELIQMGVRAIVAAGWAVDDAAALTFAQVFYERLLDNKTFGDAVKEARLAVYKNHRQTNTWGAYQCYGDPNFRLYQEEDWDGGGERPQPHSRREYRDEFKYIVGKAADSRNRDVLRQRLDELSRGLPPHWQDGAVLSELGDAWASVGDYERGVEYYERALKDESGQVTIRAVQQLANLKGRYALALWRESSGLAPSRARKRQEQQVSVDDLFRQATTHLEKVRKFLAPEETGELLAIFGAHYKNWARTTRNDNSRLEKLRRAQESYELAEQRRRGEIGRPDPYPALNRVACALLTSRQESQRKRLKEEIGEIKKAAEGWRRDDDLWKRIHYPDALLLEYLLGKKLRRPEVQAEILAAYRDAIGIGADVRRLGSIRSQFDFLIEMLTWEQERLKWPKAELDALRSIRNAVLPDKPTQDR